MKKLFFVLSLMIISLEMNAQWYKMHNDADELKGIKESESYMFLNKEIGSFIIRGLNTYWYGLQLYDGIFNVMYEDGKRGCIALVGLYDDDNNLVNKFNMWLDANDDYTFLYTRNMGTMLNPVGQKGKVKQILNKIKNGEGYIRIVVPKYPNGEFDLVIPAKMIFMF